MPQTVLLVGTRKGCFVLESDGDRRDWKVRGPFCEGWPIYHAVHDPDSGAIYAAAASEWHGAGVWRSTDLGETWELSSEGLAYADGGLKLSKVSGLTAAHGRVLAGAEAAGIFESRDGGATWSLLSTLDGQPGREDWNDPANQPPGHLGLPGDPAAPRRRRPLLGGRAGLRHLRDDRRRRVVDAAQPRAARRLAARESRGRLLRAQARDVAGRPRAPVPAEPLSACTAATTPATRGRRSPRACRREFGFAAAAHPHDRDTFYVIPLDPGHGRVMPEGSAAVWRTRDAGSTVAAARRRAAAARRAPRRAARGHGDRLARRARPLLRHEHGPGVRERRRGRELERDRELPARHLVRRGRRPRRSHGRPAPARHAAAALPRTCRADVEVDAATVDEAIERLDERWPGLRDRLCEPGPALRRHINVYVDRERAGLDTALERALAGRRDRRDQRRVAGRTRRRTSPSST